MLKKAKSPPLLAKDFDFGDSEYLDQSDQEDSFSVDMGICVFYPEWKSMNLERTENMNFFCPYCGHFVKDSDQRGCKLEGSDRVYLAHGKCIDVKQNAQIQCKYQKSIYTLQKGYLQTEKFGSAVGGKEYLLSVLVVHPFSTYKYFKTDQKVIMTDGHISLNLQIYSDSEYIYSPNKVVLPLSEMGLQLNLKEFGSNLQQQTITFNVDLSQIFLGFQITEKQNVWIINFSNSSQWTVKIQIELIFDQNLKKAQIYSMNTKYSHELIHNIPLVKFNKITLMSKNCECKLLKCCIENTKASSTFEDVYEDSREESLNQTFDLSQVLVFEPLNYQQDIIAYWKTQNGSKQLQKNIREMKVFEINSFIEKIIPFLCELLENDYANYMVQTLVSFSNKEQRMQIFQSLRENIPYLVCLKQGTFAFQQIINFASTLEQFMFFTKIMSNKFFEVATNPNGNHFLRKLVSIMPFACNQILIKNSIFHKFLDLVNNKNSVCVLKIILKSLQKQPVSISIQEIKISFINLLVMNAESIIKNEFGNYLIQEAFDVFGQNQLKQISEFIINEIKNLSKQKFSSSVICRCISTYWKDSEYFNRLKSKMNQNEIVELFRNKEGNKILLELMFSQADWAFKSKIFYAISNHMPSKYNISKWSGVSREKQQNQISSSDEVKSFDRMMSFDGIKNFKGKSCNQMAKKKYYNIH